MTDEEFQRIKEAEKERLRAQKRLRATLESLKRRNEVQSVVRRMSQGAKQLLRKTEALADKVASQAARQAARLEVAVGDETGVDASLEEDEAILREERAEAQVRRLKEEDSPISTRRSESLSVGSDESNSSDADDDPDSGRDGPDKTIGRMGDHRTDDSS